MIGVKSPLFAPVRVKTGSAGLLWSDDEDQGGESEDRRTLTQARHEYEGPVGRTRERRWDLWDNPAGPDRRCRDKTRPLVLQYLRRGV